MILTLHIVAFVVGCYVWYLTYVMQESTEGRWVNRIEEFWVRIDDRSKAVGDTTQAIFAAVAVKVTKAFNRLLGQKIISPRLIGVSGSLSFTSAFSFYGVLFELIAYLIVRYLDFFKQHTTNANTLHNGVPFLILGGLIMFALAFLCAIFAALPIVFKSSIWAWISCTPTIFAVYLFLRLAYIGKLDANQSTLFAVLPISLISDIVLLIVIRQSLAWMMVRTTPLKMAIAIVIQVVLIFAVFLLPIALMQGIGSSDNVPSSLRMGALMLAIFNVPTAIAAASFITALMIVLIHRLTWPLLSAWTYILTRRDVLEKRKLMRTIASALVVYGASGIPGSTFVLRLVTRLVQ